MPLSIESHLGPYQIVSHLGSGAMGEVYRARDTRLNRDVAIKMVSTGDADEATLRRFQQEAEAVSALNHPNILTIHDTGREDGVAFIVTELIEGPSLRKVLEKGALPQREVLDIAIQIADGLAAAHDEGIIHRDLKPENIMITHDGRVKILDFGIAKVTEALGDSSRTLGSGDTAPGLLLGTTAYMSPEQARGTNVSWFTDQFSFGVILYEMATGQSPFRRETPLSTLSAILTEDAPPLNVGSPLFQWLVKRLLHRDPDHRYRSMHDVLGELRNIRAAITEIPATHAEPHTAEPRRRLRPRWIVAGLLALAAGLASATLLWYRTPAQGSIPKEYTPLATDAGLDVFPAWSPNGRTIAYCAEVNRVLQVFTRGSGSVVPAQITSLKTDALQPFWSTDGALVYFVSGGDLYAVSATGGSPRLVLRNVVQASLSADGTLLAALRPEQQGTAVALYMGPPEGVKRYDAHGFANRRFLPWSYVRFSPDGKHLGAWLTLADGQSEFWLFPAAGGPPEQKLSRLAASPVAREFAWLPDNRRIVFSNRSELSTGSHLFVADLNTGRVDPLTVGTGSEFSPSVSPDGRSVAFAAASLNYDIVRIGLNGSVTPLLASTRFEASPSVSVTGDLAYVTDRNGQPEIWLRSMRQNWDRPLVSSASFGDDRPSFLFDTAFAPDGSRIAFRRSGSRGEAIWISSTASDSPVPLAQEPGKAFQRGPAWSPDGDSIVYFSIRNGQHVIERARLSGTEPAVVIARNAGVYPQWSPRGDLIATLGEHGGIAVFGPDGSGQRTAGTGEWMVHGWSPDGAKLYGIRRTADRRLQVVAIRISDGSESTLGELGALPPAFTYGQAIGAAPIRGFSMASDGSGFITSMLRVSSDVWTLKR